VNVRPVAAYKQTQRSSLQPGQRVGGHLALTYFAQMTQSELSHMAGAVDDSTINIVLGFSRPIIISSSSGSSILSVKKSEIKCRNLTNPYAELILRLCILTGV